MNTTRTMIEILGLCTLCVPGCVGAVGVGGGGEAEDVTACATDAACDDDNACTADACLEGGCVNVAIEDCESGGSEGEGAMTVENFWDRNLF